MTCLKLSLFAPAKSHSHHYSNYSIHNVGKNELGLFRRCSSSLINTGIVSEAWVLLSLPASPATSNLTWKVTNVAEKLVLE